VIRDGKGVIPFPVAKPSWYPEEPDTEPEYNPQLHLSATVLGMKDTNVFLLNGYDEVKVCPTSEGNEQSKLAYTRGFKVLSEEGTRQLRSVIERLRKYAKGTERSPFTIRCLGYRSKWVRDFNRCPVLLQYLSKLAGQPLMAHSIVSHYAHTNIGIIGSGQPVDQWHVDSVPFVMVLLMSDMTDAVGGKLEVIKDTKENAFKQLAETKNNIPVDKLLTAEYPGLGYALFMQGSEMVHHVTSVESAPEPRITVVNSYMPVNPFAAEQTYSYTYRHDDMHIEQHTYSSSRTSHIFHEYTVWKVNTCLIYSCLTPTPMLLPPG
jgi:hypothetical protein